VLQCIHTHYTHIHVSLCNNLGKAQQTYP
jgi:hypothetical protein